MSRCVPPPPPAVWRGRYQTVLAKRFLADSLSRARPVPLPKSLGPTTSMAPVSIDSTVRVSRYLIVQCRTLGSQPTRTRTHARASDESSRRLHARFPVCRHVGPATQRMTIDRWRAGPRHRIRRTGGPDPTIRAGVIVQKYRVAEIRSLARYHAFPPRMSHSQRTPLGLCGLHPSAPGQHVVGCMTRRALPRNTEERVLLNPRKSAPRLLRPG